MSNTQEINVVCSSCDGFCPVTAKVEDGRVLEAYYSDPSSKPVRTLTVLMPTSSMS